MKSESLTSGDWEQVVSEFRRLCMLRHQGSTAESDEILSSRLPKSIAAWSRSSTQDPTVKKTTLENMFQSEKKRIEEAMLLQEIAATRWETQVVPMLCNRITQEIRRSVSEQFSVYELQLAETSATQSTGSQRYAPKISFDNIPGIIDFIAAEERKSMNLNKSILAA